MPISRVQYDMAHANEAQTVQIGFSGASKPAAGSALIACISIWDAGSPYSYTISDTQSNTWTEIYDNNYVNQYVGGFAYALNVANANTTITVDCGSSGSYLTLVVVEVSGLLTASALDVNNQGTASSSSWNSGNVTTTQNDEYMIGFVTHENGNVTLSEDGAFTLIVEEEDGDTNMPISVGERILSSTVTDAYTGTLGATWDWYAAIASFKAIADAQRRIFSTHW